MFYTYVLLCRDFIRKRSEIYIGFTEDLENRLAVHRSHSVQTTKSFDKIDLIYYEACLDKTDAGRRELQLKTGFGRGYLKKRLESYLKRISID